MGRTMRLVWGIGLAFALAGAAAGQTQATQDQQLIRLAVELAAERDAAPIPLGPDPTNPHGWAYDRFTRAHLAARAAFLGGAPFDAMKPPRDLIAGQLIIVALPLVCGDRRVRPSDVDVHNNTRPVSKWLPVTGGALQKFLPGVSAPAGAIAVQFADASLRSGEVVRFSYTEVVCSGESRTISLPVTMTVPRILERPAIEVPANEPPPPGPITLTIAGVVDLDGRLRHATAPEASTPFGAAAMAAAMKMRFDPSRLNGSPVPWTAGVIVTFGVPAPAPAAEELSTPDTPGLTTASSQCLVSGDDTFGLAASNAIRIGGGVDGSARVLKYLAVLRGPSGQGLRYRSTGPLMMGRGVLEGFEIRHAGLPQPIRLYFDATREGQLMAPKGFACSAPIIVK